MAEQGNPNSVTDAGVGALAARSAVLGACLNVKINAAGLKDRAVADDLIGQATGSSPMRRKPSVRFWKSSRARLNNLIHIKQ